MKAKKYALTGTRKQRDGIFLLLSEFFDCFLSIFKPDNKKCHIFHLIHFDWNLFSQNALSSNLLTDILLFFKHPIKHQQNSASYIDDINDCISFWDVLKEDIKWKNRYQIDSNKILELHWDKLLCNNQRKIKSNSYLYRA